MTRFFLKRRAIFTAGLGFLATPAILRPHLFAANAQMSSSSPSQHSTDIDQFSLGSFKITAIKDGARASDKPQETFGTNQTPETVAALLQENFLPTDRFVNTFTPAVIETGTDVVLVDTGFGSKAKAQGMGFLRDGLQRAGYTPEDITVVALTHLHGDHIGGLMENGAPAFPNARYVIGQTEYDFWSDQGVGTPAEGNHKMVMSNVVPLAPKARFIGEGDEIVPGMTAMMAVGHTPGHMVFQLESDGKRLLLAGDTANHYVLSVQRPDWQVRFDMDKAQAAATRHKIFDMLAAEKIPFMGYHMPFPAVGFVEKQGDGYRFIPKTYQFDL